MISKRRLRAVRRTIWEITHVAFRHLFLPINAIIVAIVLLLVFFGQAREGLFLGIIVFLNFVFGFVQDVRAWILLERLQLLAALKLSRIREDDSEEVVQLDEIHAGDRIKLRLGDQMPCDGIILSSLSLEVNEGLITGESDSFARKEGDTILAGSIVTSGTGVARAETSFEASRMAQMTIGLERYEAHPSPIQRSIETFIQYTMYVLIAVAAFIIIRGAIIGSTNISVVEQIGALASVLVPQGLVVATTLLFSFGAGYFFRRHVLLQEVNATEKLGRVKNLCMDKTGTLTENEFTVETMRTDPRTTELEAKRYSALYVRYSGDSSDSITAVGNFCGPSDAQEIQDVLSFSSWRGYGGIAFRESDSTDVTVILMGAAESFLPHMPDEAQRRWISEFSEEQSREGKHLLCVVRAAGDTVPRDLANSSLSAIGVLALGNRLREGVQDAILFFQQRGIRIRILSGDNPVTAQAITRAAGVYDPEALITGPEMQNWNASDYAHNVGRYTIFARIEPEQKEHIIEALKLDGFTAMVGDGANDALSMKRADLGIAMLSGTQATRQVAAVVLAHNSFIELPGGMRLADSVIAHIELFAVNFLSQTFIEFFLFVALILVGIDFPLNPLNIALINQLTLGLPAMFIFYWAMNPPENTKPSDPGDFLARVFPLPAILSVVQTLGALAVYIAVQIYFPDVSPASLLIISITATGFGFFAIASGQFGAPLSLMRRWEVAAMGFMEAVLLFLVFRIPLVYEFFGTTVPPQNAVMLTLCIAAVICAAQYATVKMIPALRR